METGEESLAKFFPFHVFEELPTISAVLRAAFWRVKGNAFRTKLRTGVTGSV